MTTSQSNSVRRVLLALHLISVAIGYSLVGVAWLYATHTWTKSPLEVGLARGITYFALLATLTGLGSMGMRSGNAESIGLAISTIAAVVLLIMSPSL